MMSREESTVNECTSISDTKKRRKPTPEFFFYGRDTKKIFEHSD